MIVVRGYVETGFAGGTHEEYFEFEDGTPESVINETVQEWGEQRIEIGWEQESSLCERCGIEKNWGYCENDNCWEDSQRKVK